MVWSLSNQRTRTDADVSAGMPVFVPALAEAWITVGNGAFLLDAESKITDAYRYSAPCGQTAQYCLFADGTTTSASHLNDVDYLSQGTGTSYAAPQVTGAVALVAQAFPTLTPEEWTKRLLASAYNDFTAFQTNITGTKDFGNGVQKSYSYEWGMGVLDVAAALSPIGNTSLVNGRSVYDGERHALDNSLLRTPNAYGDGLVAMLSSTPIAVFDALNAPFLTSGEAFAVSTTDHISRAAAIPHAGAPRTISGHLAALGFSGGSQQIVLEDLGYSFGFSAVDGGKLVQNALGLGSENVNNASVLSLGEHMSAVYGSYDMGFANLEHFGFAGTHQSNRNGSLVGVGAALSFDLDPVDIRLGISQVAEEGAFLGMTSSGAFKAPDQAAISTFSLSASADITSNFSVFGGIEYGTAFAGATGGYITSIDATTFSGFQVGVRATDLFLNEDRLTFTASQPLRAETGTINLSVPVGRETDGTIVYQSVAGAITPSGRQLDLGLSYAFKPALNSYQNLWNLTHEGFLA